MPIQCCPLDHHHHETDNTINKTNKVSAPQAMKNYSITNQTSPIAFQLACMTLADGYGLRLSNEVHH